MTVTERQTVIATKDSAGNTIMHFPVTSAKYVEGAVRSVNGTEPDANGDVLVASLPIGHIYRSFNPNIPVGSLPLFGGEYSREAYADLWAWVQEQTGYLITEAEWQEMATANEGNVPRYSDGDGSTTFRVPSISCWVKGANGIEEVGSYLKAGLPNIKGSIKAGSGTEGITSGGYGVFRSASGVFEASTIQQYSPSGYQGAYPSGNPYADIGFNASRSNSIYGNSDTVQPKSIVGMWLVKAFGTVSNVGNQDVADVSAGLTAVETKFNNFNMKTYTSLAQLGLDTTASELDILKALPNGGSFVLAVEKTLHSNFSIFSKYQNIGAYGRLILFRVGNDCLSGIYTVGAELYYCQGHISNSSITWYKAYGDGTFAVRVGGASAEKPALVIESYQKGDDWYRIWSDGWIEQGGRVSSSDLDSVDVTFLKPFSSRACLIQVTPQSSNPQGCAYNNLTTTGITIIKENTVARWYACGL